MFKYLKHQLHLKLSTYSRDIVEVHEYPNALEAEAKEERQGADPTRETADTNDTEALNVTESNRNISAVFAKTRALKELERPQAGDGSVSRVYVKRKRSRYVYTGRGEFAIEIPADTCTMWNQQATEE